MIVAWTCADTLSGGGVDGDRYNTYRTAQDTMSEALWSIVEAFGFTAQPFGNYNLPPITAPPPPAEPKPRPWDATDLGNPPDVNTEPHDGEPLPALEIDTNGRLGRPCARCGVAYERHHWPQERTAGVCYANTATAAITLRPKSSARLPWFRGTSSSRHDGDDGAADRCARACDTSVGGQEAGLVAFRRGDVDGVGVTQRCLRQHPGTLYVTPRDGFHSDLEGLRIGQRLRDVGLLERMTRSVRRSAKAREHLECEVPRSAQRFAGRLGGQRLPGGFTPYAGVGNGVDDHRRVHDHRGGRSAS